MKVQITGIDESIKKLDNVINNLPEFGMRGLEEAAEFVKQAIDKEVKDWGLKYMQPMYISLFPEQLFVFIKAPIWCELWAMQGISEKRQRVWLNRFYSHALDKRTRSNIVRRSPILPFVTVRSVGTVKGIVFNWIDRLVKGQ